MVTKREITTYENVLISSQQVFARMHSALQTPSGPPCCLTHRKSFLPLLCSRPAVQELRSGKAARSCKEPHRQVGTSCHPKTPLNGSTVGERAVGRQSGLCHPSRGTSPEHGGFVNEGFSFHGPGGLILTYSKA